MCTHVYATYTFKSIIYTHINIHILRAHTWIYVYKLYTYTYKHTNIHRGRERAHTLQKKKNRSYFKF